MPHDDIIHPGDVLFTTTEGTFTQALRRLSSDIGFNYIEVSKLPIWLRDYYLSSDSETIATSIETPRGFYASSLNQNAKSAYDKVLTKTKDSGHTYFQFEGLARGFHNENDHRATYRLIEQTRRKESPHRIQGGNIIQALNRDGIKYYLVGLTLVFDAISQSVRDLQNIPQVTVNRLVGEAKLKTILELTQTFNCEPEKILFIPQWAYHIDLQMAYLKPGVILLHSFEEELRNPGTLNTNTRNKNIGYFNKRIVSNIRNLLSKHGFNVIPMKVFAMAEDNIERFQGFNTAYLGKNDGLDYSQYFHEAEQAIDHEKYYMNLATFEFSELPGEGFEPLDIEKYCHARTLINVQYAFANGVTIRDRAGRYHFICPDAPQHTAKQNLATALRRYGVDRVHFINTNPELSNAADAIALYGDHYAAKLIRISISHRK
ncbi:hypothetical protein [Dongshaea marina]|uniref:hypothetical protein n=1 Tax=Dongshaea marina TaxID=2047966 RepID=UPI000D3E2788|nr:hypothetical protein [Dongshaea marina]